MAGALILLLKILKIVEYTDIVSLGSSVEHAFDSVVYSV